jgi:class 3 adenylate cyclase
LGDGYAGVLKDVRETVRRAVARSGGREVDARADEFFAVFERPAPAIEAAVSIQRTLGGRTWPDDLECRVRAGIHSGTSTLTDTGYIGLSVNTTARICSIARGGQIVISAETKDAVDEPLPLSISFRRLGRRRLPGMTRPHDLFQVEADGILTDFPPLRRSSARPRNA